MPTLRRIGTSAARSTREKFGSVLRLPMGTGFPKSISHYTMAGESIGLRDLLSRIRQLSGLDEQQLNNLTVRLKNSLDQILTTPNLSYV